MNTGTISGTLTAPTIVSIPAGWALVNVIAALTNTGIVTFAPNVTTLDVTKDSTLSVGQSAPIKVPMGITSIAFGSSGATDTADIQLVQRKV